MAGSVNKVILIGNLGADPEIRATNSGSKVATLRIATSERWKDRNTGEMQERTEWHRVVTFSEGLVRVIENYVKKGSKVYVEGSLQTRKWTDQTGNERYTTEIVLNPFSGVLTILDSRSQGGGGFSSEGGGYNAPPSQPSSGGSFGSGGSSTGGGNDFDDEIPF